MSNFLVASTFPVISTPATAQAQAFSTKETNNEEISSLRQLVQQHHTISPDELTRISETAKEFEALVLTQLLAPIFSTVNQSELTGGGHEGETYKSLLQEHYATAIAERGGIGIADQVKASLITLQSQN